MFKKHHSLGDTAGEGMVERLLYILHVTFLHLLGGMLKHQLVAHVPRNSSLVGLGFSLKFCFSSKFANDAYAVRPGTSLRVAPQAITTLQFQFYYRPIYKLFSSKKIRTKMSENHLNSTKLKASKSCMCIFRVQ